MIGIVVASVLLIWPSGPARAVAEAPVVADLVGEAYDLSLLREAALMRLAGTPLALKARGEARVECGAELCRILVLAERLGQPQDFGAGRLVYTAWALTPEGRALNLGALRPRGRGRYALDASVEARAFALGVSAEPNARGAAPGALLVLHSAEASAAVGAPRALTPLGTLAAQADLVLAPDSLAWRALALEPDRPLPLREAYWSLADAHQANAQQAAPAVFARAQEYLKEAEGLLALRQRDAAGEAAQRAVELAEHARGQAAERRELRLTQARVEAERSAEEIERRAEGARESARRSLALWLPPEERGELRDAPASPPSPAQERLVGRFELFFAPGEDEPRGAVYDAVLAEAARLWSPGARIVVEGYADSGKERGQGRRLAFARGVAVANRLAELGVPAEAVVSFGREEAAAPGAGPELLQRQRRAVISVLAGEY